MFLFDSSFWEDVVLPVLVVLVLAALGLLSLPWIVIAYMNYSTWVWKIGGIR